MRGMQALVGPGQPSGGTHEGLKWYVVSIICTYSGVGIFAIIWPSLALLARSPHPWYPFPHVLRVLPVPSTNPIVKILRVCSPAPSLLRAKMLYVRS